MKLNEFIWNNYKQTQRGIETIEAFKLGDLETIIPKFAKSLPFGPEATIVYIDNVLEYIFEPNLANEISFDEAEKLLTNLYETGITFLFENDEKINSGPLKTQYFNVISEISTWLYLKYPSIFKPYYFRNNFDVLTKIADTFEFDLPDVPLKRNHKDRFFYFFEWCKTLSNFQIENNLNDEELCAFLYDFAPNFFEIENKKDSQLPEPTQVWWIGGDKGGGDFEFLDNANNEDTNYWQGNQDTRKGDILVMYCLSPRSYIHSIWRATRDGIVDPFFYYYGNIYIGFGQKVSPIGINELKKDEYFGKNPLVRKNLQGINGYPLSSEDYDYLQKMLSERGYDTSNLPQLYNYVFEQNKDLKNEREVETELIEPFLIKIGYTENDWIRQLTLRMGKGERNFPDYAFLSDNTKGYEKAFMLIESKFHIKNNRELEDTFKQVWSYGQRLSSRILIIADKDSIWIYKQINNSFERNTYKKYFWKELKDPDIYNEIKKILI